MRRVAPVHTFARMLYSIAGLLCLAIVIASCSTNDSKPFSRTSPGASSGRIPPPIAIIAMNGMPAAKAGIMADALAEAAGQRDVAIVQGNFSDGYQLAGNFRTVQEGGGVRLFYDWRLTGNTGGALHAINGQELVPSTGPDPWLGVSDVIIKRIASVTAENLATKLAQLGFKVRQAGVLPPTHTFAKAGPGAENEIDLETYYGPNSPFTTASITPNELYTLSPEELDKRLTAAAERQAQERLKAAGIDSVEELLGEERVASRDQTPDLPRARSNTGPIASKPAQAVTDSPGEPVDTSGLATAQPAPDATTETVAAVEPGGPIDQVALVGVTGAPGKGNDELFRAMRKVLRQAGWPVVRKPGNTSLAISGRVELAQAEGGVQKVRLAWAVMLPTGKVLGTVRQANDVPAGSLNEGWGQTAGYAAEAAAEGIFNLVEQMRNK